MSTSYPTDVAEFDDSPPPEEVVDGVYYPSSDGEEMGESDWHIVAMTTLFFMLRERYAGQDVYVAADMMLYYEEGNPRAVRAPDCMVIFGVKSHPRRSWLSWVEGALPSVVFEFASQHTHREDLGPKRDLYESLGIPEYFFFDPVGDYSPGRPFLGFQLVDGAYVAKPAIEGDGYVSDVLGLMITPEGSTLRLVDLATHRALRTSGEKTAWIESRERIARKRGRRAIRAERRAREATLQAEAERILRENETRRAEYEALRAENAMLRNEILAAENARLRAALEQRPSAGGGSDG